MPAPGWMNAPGVPPLPSGAEGPLEIVFRPDPTIFDGRFANNGWLQELPKPITTITWDNTAVISPATAVSLGLAVEETPEAASEVIGQMVRLEFAGRTVEAPVWVAPGHPNDSITIHLGYGRTRAGNVGTGKGFDAYRLRPSGKPWFGRGLTVTRLNRHYELARVQSHHALNGRGDEIIREGTRINLPTIPAAAHEPRTGPSLYPARDNSGHQWGMAIDLTLCTGCSACVVACQSENNIPVVGKDQVARGREMHWLRINSYHKGAHREPALLQTFFQPLACVQCENAPCEVVCPVGATVHSRDGLNDMVYNRCVGTRYCSNNCPYKVRRFNFLQYSDWAAEALRPMRNPDVTVRSRGVMEKCTYCVQRIRQKDIDAQREGRPLRDGEIQTACQAACPAGAIVFGDLNLHGSRVAALQAGSLNYGLLYELNTRPRTTYLAAVKNPNENIERLERGAAR
jgi:molybdopterin-containing oxidoreductase family iron-sulfur binding subunit